jgi:hypothetical protein
MTKKMAQNREKMRDKSNVFDFILVLFNPFFIVRAPPPQQLAGAEGIQKYPPHKK